MRRWAVRVVWLFGFAGYGFGLAAWAARQQSRDDYRYAYEALAEARAGLEAVYNSVGRCERFLRNVEGILRGPYAPPIRFGMIPPENFFEATEED